MHMTPEYLNETRVPFFHRFGLDGLVIADD